MTKTPAEMMKEFVKSQNFTTTDEVMAAKKEMFRFLHLYQLKQIMKLVFVDKGIRGFE